MVLHKRNLHEKRHYSCSIQKILRNHLPKHF